MNPLIERIREISRPLQPEATGRVCSTEKISGIRAVLFDVYGTLFISGSGDISLAGSDTGEAPMRDVLARHGVSILDDEQGYREAFLGRIRSRRQRCIDQGTPHPEVEIREVWRDFLEEGRENGSMAGDLERVDVEALAVDYECRVNPVWPMPGALEVLRELQGRGLPLGIVSNAQFFTPLLFPALLDADPETLGFRPELCSWSYREGVGKPDRDLFARPLEALRQTGIEAGEVVFVGNDLLNDIWTARECGLRTAWFVGDQRSLRMRTDDPRCAGLVPDLTVARLEDLSGLLV